MRGYGTSIIEQTKVVQGTEAPAAKLCMHALEELITSLSLCTTAGHVLFNLARHSRRLAFYCCDLDHQLDLS